MLLPFVAVSVCCSSLLNRATRARTLDVEFDLFALETGRQVQLRGRTGRDAENIAACPAFEMRVWVIMLTHGTEPENPFIISDLVRQALAGKPVQHPIDRYAVDMLVGERLLHIAMGQRTIGLG